MRPDLPRAYAPPRTDDEEELSQIWGAVLGVNQIGIHDSFFELGGDSILGIQIVTKARNAGYDLTQTQLFQQPTVAKLAAAVSRQAISIVDRQPERPLLPEADHNKLNQQFGDNLETAYPLAPLQEGILFHTLLHPEDDIYFEQPAFTIDGLLEPVVLEQAWRQVVARHPILRTIFMWEGWERPLQIVLRHTAPRWQLLDWRQYDAGEQAAKMQQFLVDNQNEGLSLGQQPPHRLTLIQLSAQETRLIWTVHHIIIDGWTESLLYKELFTIYEAVLHAKPHDLPQPEPFETFIRWQQQQDWQQAQQFWQKALAGFAVPTPLTVDIGQPLARHDLAQHLRQTYGERRFQLPSALHDALKTFSRQHHLTLGTLLQAAWGLLLSRYSNEPDVVFGTMMSGRVPQLSGVDKIAGVLINPVPVRTQIEPDATVLPWLTQFQANLLALQEHETVPLVQVQSWSDLPPDQPLFESLMVVENYPRQRHASGGQLTIRDYFSYERTNYPLTLRIIPDEEVDVFLVYDADRLAETAVSRIYDHWCNLLAGIVADGERPLAQLPLITQPEAQQLLYDWNEWTAVYPPSSCIHHEFERQVAQSPNAIAVKFGDKQLTYSELNAKANQLAHFLQQHGVLQNDLVALYLERSLDMVIAILGALKAGGAYLPMDTAYPPERLAFMLEDAQPIACLSQSDIASNLQSPVSNLILLDKDWPQIATQPSHNPTRPIEPHNRAYVIYTSGSTGKPKGVLVTHQNVMRLFQATDNWYHFDKNDAWTLFHSYAFDFSVWEIWGALLYGGRLVVVPYLTSRSPQEFYRLLVAEGVTVLNQTPSAFRQLIQAEAELGQDDNLALRTVIFGGEALELNTLQPWFDCHGDQKPQLVNMYGITETTVHVTYRPIYSNDVAQAPGSFIGRPIPDLQLFILDSQQQPVPIGVPGEIYVGGAGVAAGYLNRPELTAERFVQLPMIGNQFSVNGEQFSVNRPPTTVYRTGDLARWLPDGDIEYLGRIDDQVKIRGFRIELGEIEAALGSHTAVRELLVLVREDQPGEKRLVAYLVLDPTEPVTVSELRGYLQPKLPAYMIPAAFVLLEAFPLTTNGKIDRRNLPHPDETRPELERPYTSPRTPAEETLVAIWSRVLNVAQVGVDDTFFELGGDSIRSIQVLAQARQAGLPFTLADLFNQQTIAKLAAAIAPQLAVSFSETAPFGLISAADRAKLPPTVEDAYPLSRLQAGMLFHAELAAESAVYHNVMSWHIQAAFNGEVLATAVQQLAQKYAILRTSFDLTSYSEPLQLVWPQVQIPVQLHDLRQLDIEAQEIEIGRWVEQLVADKFDWTQPPLLRFHFFQRSETTFQMLMNEHHAILDGWSVASLTTELLQTYRTLLAGAVADPVEAVPYREFIAAERATLAAAEARAFWQDALAERSFSKMPRLPLPVDLDALPETAASLGSTSGSTKLSSSGQLVYQTTISADQVAKLNQVAHRAGVPLKSVLLAAHLKVLGFVSGQEDVLSGLVMNGRTEHSGSEQALGLFLNSAPFRQKLAAGSWLDLIQQTFATEMALLPHRRFPLPDIQQMLGGQPLFEVAFNFLHFHVFDALANDDQITVLAEEFFGYTDLALSIDAELNVFNGTLLLRLEYNSAEFSAAQIEEMAGYFGRTLRALADEPEAAHHEFSPLSQAERQQLLVDWNNTNVPYPQAQTVVDLFAAQAAKTPQATAVATLPDPKSGQTTQLTYTQLNRRANQLAHTLRSLGVRPNMVVAICLERSPNMIVALWGILKAGAAYVPIDPNYPQERIDFILKDTQAAVLLTQTSLINQLFTDAQVLCLDTDWTTIAQADDTDPVPLATPNHTAYIIYTSGSTGQPKGVLISHRSLLHYVTIGVAHLDFQPQDVALQFASLSFDTAVEEIFPPLLCGARLLLRNDEMLATTADFWQTCAGNDVTVLNLPTAFWHLLCSQLANDAHLISASLRLLIIGGEKALPEQIQSWWRQAPAFVRLVNSYGPTETTVVAIACDLTGSNAPREMDKAIIGRPIPNTRVYLLNSRSQLVPVGVWGELHIGGVGLAQGYLNRPELTAVHFIPDPFSQEPGARLYKTGDMARYLPDGHIEYQGRLDNQVKIRGFRIELEEIETALGGHPSVQEVLVLVREDQPGEKQLVAYLVLGAARLVSISELRSYLQPKLPAYMIPAAFVLLEAFPLTTNGKIDRRALPLPNETRPELERPYSPPLTPAEETLAAIWSQVLNVTRVGINDNYFELGGDSIRSIQVLAQARQAGLTFSLADLFNQQTIANLVTSIAPQKMATSASSTSLGSSGQAVSFSKTAPFSLISVDDRAKLPPTIEDAYPLSKLQAGMLFHAELAVDSAVYYNVTSWHIQAMFDGEMLATAVQQLAQKHPILRTSFDLTSYSEPLQLVWPQVQIPVQLHDLRQLTTEAQEAEIDRWIKQLIADKFDWTTPPLLRFHFFQRGDTTFQMLQNEHHAILDGWSMASLMTELFQTYQALLDDTVAEPAEFVEAAVPYREFIAAEQATLADAEARAFWQDTLAESSISTVPRLPLPDDLDELPETAASSGSVKDTYQTIIPADQVTKLNQVAQQAGVPLKSVLLAAHLKVLGFVSGQNDVLAGLVMNGRTEQTGSERALGLFLNTVPFRQKLATGSWLDLIQQTFATEVALLPHRRFPLAEIQQMQGGQPLFEMPFNYLHFHVLDSLAENEQIAILDEQSFGYNDFALSVDAVLNAINGSLTLSLEYNTAEFSLTQIEEMAGYFDRTLVALTAEPEAAHQVFSPLSAAERQQLLVDWNATEAPLPDLLIHEWVAQVAAEMPEETAVSYQNQSLNYAQLNAKANQMARHLRQLGVGPDTIVGIFMERSIEMMVALLGVHKAGGAYLPLDPTYPQDRLALMVADSATPVLLTQEHLVASLPPHQAQVVHVDADWELITGHSDENFFSGVASDNLAYIIYTSGSTGKPKGAMITHGGLANYLNWAFQTYPVQAGGAPVHSSIGFDLTVTGLFLPLLAGQPVHLLPEEDSGSLLNEALTDQGGFGLVKITPAHLLLLNQTVPADKAADSTESFVVGGEQLTAEQLAFWRQHAPNTRLFNEYGPTETVVGCCVYEVLPEDDLGGAVPIGQPIANTQLYVLDELMQLVPVGGTGELYIGGLGVARGYLKRPSLTAEKFVPDPFSNVPGARLYRTGDLARLRPDGNLEFLGRLDHQVKIRGYRIELGEIEAEMGQHENVRETAVLVQESSGSKRLVAYVVPRQAPTPSAADLRRFLGHTLPDYMIPALFVPLDTMPLTINGKIDRRALPQPDDARPELERPYMPPRNPAEETLAAIWSRVLNVAQVGIHDSFFELGGDSIRSIQVLAQARQAGLAFSLADMFNQQTIANLVEAVAPQAMGTSLGSTSLSSSVQAVALTETTPFSLISAADQTKLPPAAEDAYPLSKLQAGMLFHAELAAETAVYHNVHSWHIQAVFDGEKLEIAVQQLAKKHAILRASFDLTSYSEPLQLVWPLVKVPVQLHDLRQLDTEAQEAEIGRWVTQLIADKFDWAQPPLLRFHFFQRSETTFQMLLNEHHAILDGWSMASLMTELFQTYQALLNGTVAESVEAVPYREFIAAEQATLASAEARAFWQDALAESSISTVPRLLLPAEHADLPEMVVYDTIISSDQVVQLKQVAHQAGVPLKSVLLAAHLKVLGFVSGQNDVLSGLVMNGRTEHSGSEQSLGLFLNTVPFRQKLAAGSWLDLVQQTFATEKALLPHRRFPLAEIQQNQGGQPLFEVPFTYLHFHVLDSLAENEAARYFG